MRIKGEPNDTQWRTIFFTMSLTKALTIEKCFHAKYLNSRQQKLLNNWIPLQILKCEYNQKKNTAKTNELLLNAKEKNSKQHNTVYCGTPPPRVREYSYQRMKFNQTHTNWTTECYMAQMLTDTSTATQSSIMFSSATRLD